MDILFPDYKNCTANLACSILRHFGAEAPNPSLPVADGLLACSARNVVVLLLDGMGRSILERHLQPGGFFRRNLCGIYSSVFPTTTVAATTSIDSGLYPNQHCWLGWDCYYPQLGKNVTVFSNTLQGTDEQAAYFNAARTFCPYERVSDRLRRSGIDAYDATPFLEPYPDDFDKICARITELCSLPGRKYVYAYWSEPDHAMHQHGIASPKVNRLLKSLEEKTEHLADGLSDTLLLVTADHGQVDSSLANINDFPDVTKYLLRQPSIEPRALNLFASPGQTENLKNAFMAEFGDKFIVYYKEEVKKMRLFGPGSDGEHFGKMLGDLLAVAVGDLTIFNDTRSITGVHAGLTADEMLVPLIALQK